MPAVGPDSASLCFVLRPGVARLGHEDRRPRPPLKAEADLVPTAGNVPGDEHPGRRRATAGVRRRDQGHAAPARARHARDLLPPEQGAGERDRRRGAGNAAAATAVRLEIVHSTRYRYTGPIAETVMEVRLRPMDGNGQRCLDFNLELSHGVKASSYVDGFGNHVHYFNLVRPHSGLSVISRSIVETGLGPDADPGEELVHDFLRFRSPVKDVEGVRELARRRAIAEPPSPESIEQALDELTLT